MSTTSGGSAPPPHRLPMYFGLSDGNAAKPPHEARLWAQQHKTGRASSALPHAAVTAAAVHAVSAAVLQSGC